jgi:hypothetical protein
LPACPFAIAVLAFFSVGLEKGALQQLPNAGSQSALSLVGKPVHQLVEGPPLAAKIKEFGNERVTGAPLASEVILKYERRT